MTDDVTEGAWAEYPRFRGLTPAHRVYGCGSCGNPLLSRDHRDEKGDDPYGEADGLPPLVRAKKSRKIEGQRKPHDVPYCVRCWEASHADRRPGWSAGVAKSQYAVGG